MRDRLRPDFVTFSGNLTITERLPVDTGCKLNVHKTFRRRPRSKTVKNKYVTKVHAFKTLLQTLRLGALVKESIFCVKTACQQRCSSQVFFNDLDHRWRATSKQKNSLLNIHDFHRRPPNNCYNLVKWKIFKKSFEGAK